MSYNEINVEKFINIIISDLTNIFITHYLSFTNQYLTASSVTGPNNPDGSYLLSGV